MKTIDKVKQWLIDADKISNVKRVFANKTKNTNVDKFAIGFNKDHRFKSFRVELYFGGYTGDFGSSSVYNFLKLNDSEVAGEAIIDFCKKNEDELLNYIANFYKDKAIKAKNKAKEELQTDLDIINSLEQETGK